MIAADRPGLQDIEVKDLVSGYAGIDVLRGISTTLAAGKVTVLIGHNGAGKTTFAKTLIGTIRLSRGDIMMGGQQLGATSVRSRIEAGIALVLQEGAVFPTLSVADNLDFVLHRLGRKSGRNALDPVWSMFPALHDARSRMAGSLSGGQQRMLAIAMGVLLEPRLLILDEPSLGLSPLIVKDVMNQARSISERAGTAILLIEQNVDAAIRVADHVLAMRNGQFVFDGPRSALSSPEQVMELL